MKKYLVPAFVAMSFFSANAQQTKTFNDPLLLFKEAKDYYQHEYYNLAYPLFKELGLNMRSADQVKMVFTYDEVNYYTIACALKQDDPGAPDVAEDYINTSDNHPRIAMMAFHLGEYYFRQKDFYKAIKYYDQADIAQLSNREVADMKFHKAYAYFHQQKFKEAKPLFNAIRQLPKDPNYMDACYYYSFIVFNEGNYTEALDGFKKVENEARYRTVVPYYIATIYYNTGEKDKALTYALDKLNQGGQYYDTELRQLVGHAYFEKKEYAKALPYLETYVTKAKTVRREDQYELSYAYYDAGNYSKAINGFKQLGGKEDALAQNAMYLLGDSYLKTGQKANARNAFLFCATNSSNEEQKEISTFNYAKLSYELGYQDIAQTELENFIKTYPHSAYFDEARELMVSLMANTNNFRDALTLLESISNPSDNVKRLQARVLYGRAMEYVNDGMLLKANELLDKALKIKYNESVLPLVNFWKGEISFRLEKTDDAILYYNNYLKSPTVNGEVNPANARYNLGYCYLKKENYKQALAYFEQVAKSPAGGDATSMEQDAYVRAADCSYMLRDYKKAVPMYDQVIAKGWPASDYATFQKAMVAGVTNSNEKIRLLQGITKTYAGSSLVADANMEIANTYLSEEKFTEALPYLKNVTANTNNESLKPKAMLQSGIAYYNLNRNSDALAQYEALIKQYPNSQEADEALDNAKSIYVEEGKSSEYVNFAKSMGRNISASAEDSLSYAEASVQFNNGNLDAALAKYNNYLSRFPDGKSSIEAYYYRSEIYAGKKDWNNAVTGYEIVSDRVPNKFGEKALLQASRINYFDLKNYEKAERYYTKLKDFASTQQNKLEAARGLLRSQYNLKKWDDASANAKDLLAEKGSSTDDKALANMALAKSAQNNNQCELAESYFRTVITLNKGEYAAEARYEIANCQLRQNKPKEAEKSAFEVINKSGSYEWWVTKSYILLGDIYYNQKDYFNAKATFQSVIDNSTQPALKEEAQQKLALVKEEEGKGNKVN